MSDSPALPETPALPTGVTFDKIEIHEVERLDVGDGADPANGAPRARRSQRGLEDGAAPRASKRKSVKHAASDVIGDNPHVLEKLRETSKEDDGANKQLLVQLQQERAQQQTKQGKHTDRAMRRTEKLQEQQNLAALNEIVAMDKHEIIADEEHHDELLARMAEEDEGPRRVSTKGPAAFSGKQKAVVVGAFLVGLFAVILMGLWHPHERDKTVHTTKLVGRDSGCSMDRGCRVVGAHHETCRLWTVAVVEPPPARNS